MTYNQHALTRCADCGTQFETYELTRVTQKTVLGRIICPDCSRRIQEAAA